MQIWWVNQNQTYRYEVGGGYLWSPKANRDGRRNRFYDSMTETAAGDVVFSFSDTLIKAVGVVTGECSSAPKPPEFGSAGANWSDEGWYLPVRFTELRHPVRPKDHMDLIGPTLPDKYSPLQANGNGLQGVYLAPVPDDLGAIIYRLLAGQAEEIARSTVPEPNPLRDVQRVLSDPSVQETVQQQLVNARIGQGLFRSRVELIEPYCRITGVTDRRFLRASHIKPWVDSDNRERLDGHNGLLLSPHVDHLFDKGC
ncbi:MAG: HNH endonuclease signature motif containing protein [Betaproteobacteria bacterium]